MPPPAQEDDDGDRGVVRAHLAPTPSVAALRLRLGRGHCARATADLAVVLLARTGVVHGRKRRIDEPRVVIAAPGRPEARASSVRDIDLPRWTRCDDPPSAVTRERPIQRHRRPIHPPSNPRRACPVGSTVEPVSWPSPCMPRRTAESAPNGPPGIASARAPHSLVDGDHWTNGAPRSPIRSRGICFRRPASRGHGIVRQTGRSVCDGHWLAGPSANGVRRHGRWPEGPVPSCPSCPQR